MHRHLLVFIPPVMTVPWHGDSIGGGESLSTAHNYSTTEEKEIFPYHFVLLLEGTSTRVDPSPGEGAFATAAPGKGWCGLQWAPGRVFFLSGINSGFSPLALSTPLPSGLEGIR